MQVLFSYVFTSSWKWKSNIPIGKNVFVSSSNDIFHVCSSQLYYFEFPMFRSSYGNIMWHCTGHPMSNIPYTAVTAFAFRKIGKNTPFFSLKNSKSKYWLSKAVHAEVHRRLFIFQLSPSILFLFLLLWHFKISYSHGQWRTGSCWNVLVTHWNRSLFLPQSEAVFTRSESANSLSSGRVRSLTNATIATVVRQYELC